MRCDSMMFALMVGDKKLVHNAKAQKGTVLDPRFHISIYKPSEEIILLNNDDMVLMVTSLYQTISWPTNLYISC